MARGDECRFKHRQDVGASSSGPSAKPKKLAKRPRPSSYQEESSPEVFPPILLGTPRFAKFGKQNCIILNCWKTLSVYHQSPKGGRLKVHLAPRLGFGGLMTNN
jgi:hypothetical protein